jgi:hypothetical protein
MTYTEADLKPVPQSELTGIPLLREQWDAAKAEPEGWGQESWIHQGDTETLDPAVVAFIAEHHVPPWNCGTKCCVAGRIALAKGARLIPDTAGWVGEGRELDTAWILTPEGEMKAVEAYAKRVTGLSRDQVGYLFHSGNTMEDIEAMVCALEENPDADLFFTSSEDEGDDDDE